MHAFTGVNADHGAGRTHAVTTRARFSVPEDDYALTERNTGPATARP